MFLEEEVLRLLEFEVGGKDEAHKKKIESVVGNLRISLLQWSKEISPTPGALSPANDKLLITCIGDALRVNGEVASTLLNEFSTKSKAIEAYLANPEKVDSITMNEFHVLRNFFIQKRQYGWYIVQDILHMDMDNNHDSHSYASVLANDLVNSDFVSNVIKHLRVLHNWTPGSIESSKFKTFARNDVSSFIRTERVAWAIGICQEIEAALDVLILISYSRRPLDLNLFKEVVALFVEHRMDVVHFTSAFGIVELDQSNPSVDVNQCILKVYFKYMTLFAANFQFWRMFEGSIEDSVRLNHPLLSPSQSSTGGAGNVEMISTTLCNRLRGYSSNDVSSNSQLHSQACLLLLFMWDQFLQAYGSHFPPDTKMGSSYHEVHAIASSSCAHVSELLLVLARSVFGTKNSFRPTTKSSQHNPNEIMYAHIMQEVLNLFIDRVTLSDNSLRDLGVVVTLTEIFYMADLEMCEKFWSMWVNQNSYPLCRLVNVLVDNTLHDPVYLLLIMNAVCSTPVACFKVMELLNRPIQAITKVLCDDIAPLSPFPQGESTFFAGQEVELSRSGNSNHRFFLSTPAVGTTGRIILLEESGQTVLVQWTHISVWWTIIFEIVIHVASASISLSTFEVQKMVSSLVSLLCKFLSQQNLVSGYLLKSKWNEIALYSFLCSMNLGEVYPLLASAGESLSLLQGNADNNFHRLVKIGVENESAAKLIVSRAASSSRDGGMFYFYSLTELLGYFACNTLTQIVPPHHLRNSALSNPMDQGPALELVSHSLELLNTLLSSPIFSVSTTINIVQGNFYNSRSSSYHEYLTELSCNYSSEFSAVLFPVINQQAIQVAKTLYSYSYTHNYWYHAFNEIMVHNDDGGLLDREVFVSSVLKKYGCTLPPSVIDHLFQSCTPEGNKVSRNHCMFFFAGLNSESASARNWFDISESDLAETSQQLANLKTNIQLDVDGMRKSCTEFGLRYVNLIVEELQHLVKQITAVEASSADNTGRVHLMVGCVEAFEFLLSTLGTEDKYAVCQEYISPKYTFMWEVILQCALSFGLLSSHNKGELTPRHGRTSALSFKAMYGATRDTRATAAQDAALIPVDFNGLLPYLSLETTDHLIRLSLKTTELLMVVIDAATTSQCLPALQTLRTIFVASSRWMITIQGQGLPPRSYQSYQSSRSAAIGNLNPTSYIAVLASLLGVSLVHWSNLVKVLKISFTRLFTKAVCMLPSHTTPTEDNNQLLYYNQSPFISSLNMVNIPGLCEIIRDNILPVHHETEATKRLTTATLSLLLAIGEHQPAAFTALLSVSKVAPRFASHSEDLMIVSMLSTLIQSSETLYEKTPLQLYLVLQIIRVLWTENHQLVQTRATLQLIQSKDFWIHLTRPLMSNLPDVQNLTQGPSETMWDAANSFYNDWDGTIQSLMSAETIEEQDQCMENVVNSVLAQVRSKEMDVDMTCQRILVHSTVLQLLSLERHGLFFEKDVAIAKSTNKTVNDFYVHANEHHRFISWMKHYLAVSSGNPKQVPSLQQQATAFGVDVASLLQDRCLRNSTSESGSRSGNNASYGYLCVSRFEFHIFSHVLVHTFGEGLVRTTMRSSSIFSAFLFFEKSVRLLVHETLIGRAQATLVDSWARFIEFYILPGSALMQHTVGKVADPANASEEHKEKSQSALEMYSSTPIVGGAMSPLSSELHSSSPVTMSKSSAFSGDKRSYEVLAELMSSLRDPQAIIEAVGSSAKVFAMAAKCQLLLSMLHHQLKDVAMKTSDPARSEVYTRDSETTRLKLLKLISYLEIIVSSCSNLNINLTSLAQNLSTPLRNAHLLLLRSFYPDLGVDDTNLVNFYFSSTTSKPINKIDDHDSWKEYLGTISVRLFTAMLLIVRQLHHSRTIFDGFENTASNEGVQFRRVFQLAVHTFRALLQGKAGAGVLAKPAESINEPNSLPQILIRLMQLTLPAKSISTTVREDWGRTLTHPSWGTTRPYDEATLHYSDDIITLTLTVLQKILTSQLLSEFPKTDAQRNKVLDSESRSTISASLHGIVDLLTAFIDCAVLEKDKIGYIGSQVLTIVLNSEVFSVYQRSILSQHREQDWAMVFYDDVGEESSASACWRRVITLISAIITTIDYDSHEDPSFAAQKSTHHANLTQLVCQFFNDFKVIILLPFRRRVGKYSLKQLEMMNLTANMFVYANTHMRQHIWRLLSPEVYASFLDRVFAVSQTLSTILSGAEESTTTNSSQYRLSSWCSAISKSEKAAENFLFPLESTGLLSSDGKSPRKLSSSGQADTATPAIDIRKNSYLFSPAGLDHDGTGSPRHMMMPFSKSASTAAANKTLLLHESGGNLFLLEVEASIVAALLALTSFVRQITPEPIDSSFIISESNALHYPAGSRVFYLSACDSESTVHGGLVVRTHGERFLDIAQHPSNLLDTYVPVSSVKYTSAPLLAFWSDARNAHHNGGNTADSRILSTAHLLRCLKVTLLPSTALRLCRTYATTRADNKEEPSRKSKTDRRGSLDEAGLGLGLGFAGPAQGLNLHLLSGQLAFLINIAHHAHAPLGKEADMIHQLEEVQRLLRMRDPALGSGTMSVTRLLAHSRHGGGGGGGGGGGRASGPPTPTGSSSTRTVSGSGSSGSIGSNEARATAAAHLSHRWMDGSEWLAYVDWIDKWCHDLIIRLGGASAAGQPEVTHIMASPNNISPEGQRKKRMGLRSKVDWVQSPEDL